MLTNNERVPIVKIVNVWQQVLYMFESFFFAMTDYILVVNISSPTAFLFIYSPYYIGALQDADSSSCNDLFGTSVVVTCSVWSSSWCHAFYKHHQRRAGLVHPPLLASHSYLHTRCESSYPRMVIHYPQNNNQSHTRVFHPLHPYRLYISLPRNNARRSIDCVLYQFIFFYPLANNEMYLCVVLLCR